MKTLVNMVLKLGVGTENFGTESLIKFYYVDVHVFNIT